MHQTSSLADDLEIALFPQFLGKAPSGTTSRTRSSTATRHVPAGHVAVPHQEDHALPSSKQDGPDAQHQAACQDEDAMRESR